MTTVNTSLTPLEVATGLVYGIEDPVPELPRPRSGDTPLAALERACLPALADPPCLVSFSGGRDSSLVLAAATRVARRHGLPLPVPATNRFPGVDDAEESHWQELVVRRLGLADWLRLEFTEELDAVGPIATRALRRHGLLWPFNAHFHVPLLEAARGGFLLTGIGGDEVFGDPRWARATAVLSGLERPRPRDVARIGLLAAPPALRRPVLARRVGVRLPWLRPAAQRRFARLLAGDQAREPARMRARLRVLQARRMLRVGLHSLQILAVDAGARIAHPLASPELCAAVAAAASWRGFEDRTRAMHALFGGVVPAELLSRSTKARFDGAFWAGASRAFAASWRGEGIDPGVVDERALRTVWAQPQPDPHTYLMLQAAWLERAASGELDHRSVPGVARAAYASLTVTTELEKAT